jgi:nanoRNase/pAp phosphatase (c-di-AMP/oligoRNAs hydrolase)
MEVERRLEHAKPVALGTRRIEAVNASTNRSRIGHQHADRARFGPQWGLVYRVEGADVFATLYSIGELDVARIALEYGGGGHRNAAGFRVSLERWLAEFVI